MALWYLNRTQLPSERWESESGKSESASADALSFAFEKGLKTNEYASSGSHHRVTSVFGKYARNYDFSPKLQGMITMSSGRILQIGTN